MRRHRHPSRNKVNRAARALSTRRGAGESAALHTPLVESLEGRQMLAADVLIVQITTTVTSVLPGQALTVTWGVVNQGDLPTSNGNATFNSAVLWSPDAAITKTDLLVVKEPIETLDSYTGKYDSVDITVPVNAVPGRTYYLGVIADIDDQIIEDSETNNDDAPPVAITILQPPQPDLTTTKISINGSDTGATVHPGDNVTLAFDIANQGQAAVNTSIHARWAFGPTVNSMQTSIDSGTLTGGLAVGASRKLNDDGWVVPNIAPGTYYLTNFVDDDTAVDESNENNNLTSVAFTVLPPPLDINVLGNSTPIVNFDPIPSVLDDTNFGSAGLGGLGVIHVFTVRNDGATTPLTGLGVSVGTGFAVVEGLAGAVSPGQSDTFSIRMETGSLGIKTADVVIRSNDPDEDPFVFAVGGEITPPQDIAILGNNKVIAVGDTTPSKDDFTVFPPAIVGSAGSTRIFTIRNDGGQPLLPVSVSLPTGFSVASSLITTPIAPGGSRTLTIRLDAASAGTKSGTLSIVSNDLDESPYTFTISGLVGTAPKLGLSFGGVNIPNGDANPSTAKGTAFDPARPGDPGPTRSFTLSNTGGIPLAVSGLVMPDGFLTVDVPDEVAPGSTGQLVIRLDPNSPGTHTGVVRFTSNDTTKNPFTFTVTGQTLILPDIDLQGINSQTIPFGQTEPADYNGTAFGTTARSQPSIDRVFTVRNRGSANLNIGELTLPDGFSLVDGLPSVLAAGASDTFTVRLITSAAGDFAGNISIVNDDEGETPFTFAVSGTVLTKDLAYSVALTETSGNSLNPDTNTGQINLLPGTTFIARVSVRDIHTPITPAGASAAFVDMVFDPAVISFNAATLVIAQGFELDHSGALDAVNGLVDEAGGRTTLPTIGLIDPQLLYSITGQVIATTNQNTTLSLNAADVSPAHDSFLSGSETAVVPSNIIYTSTLIRVAATNEPPTIQSLGATPPKPIQPSSLTLTARNVADPETAPTLVEFYLDTNRNGVLEPDLDRLLGTDDSATNNWTITISTGELPIGSNHYFARATDGEDFGAPVTITDTVGSPDIYEKNDTKPAVDLQPIGGVNSPNLGALTKTRTIKNLNTTDNAVDFFKFQTRATGTSANYVQITFTNLLGNLDLALLKANGRSNAARQSASTDLNQEKISLNRVPAGVYYIRVTGVDGAANPSYTLKIVPPKAKSQKLTAAHSLPISAESRQPATARPIHRRPAAGLFNTDRPIL